MAKKNRGHKKPTGMKAGKKKVAVAKLKGPLKVGVQYDLSNSQLSRLLSGFFR